MTAPVEVAQSVPIPADVEREDRVLGNLTARQVAIFAGTGMALYLLFAATRSLVPVGVFAIVAIPIGCAVTVIVLGVRDGISLDRLLVAAMRQRRAPSLQLAHVGETAPIPGWITAHTRHADGTSRRQATPLDLDALRLPRYPATDSGGARAGMLDLGADGLVVVCAASTINFALRTAAEQEALVGGFARYLHSLTAPVQILITAEHLDLTEHVKDLRGQAARLPHPALEAAALGHAEFLGELAGQGDLLRRQVWIVLREPAAPQAITALRTSWLRRYRAGSVDTRAMAAAETRLARRVREAIELLAPVGIAVAPLDARLATDLLARSCNPDRLTASAGSLADPGAVITSAFPGGVEERWDR